jgi:hypothetical protein
MTKKIVTTVILIIIALFLCWYGYQEYKKSQYVVTEVIEAS